MVVDMEPLDTRQRGDFAEAAVLHALTEAGLLVFMPFGRFGPYDMIVDMPGGRLVRVQVKSGRVRRGCVIFNSCSTDHGRGREDYLGKADVFAVHAPTPDSVYVLDVAAAVTRVTTLRLEPTRNAQQRRIRFAADHTLANWLRRSAVVATGIAEPTAR
jgi:hypothetical protein